MGESTGAAVIFGATGGVMEAAVRTAFAVLTNGNPLKIDFQEIRGLEGVREATVHVKDGLDLRLAVVYGLANARKILEMIEKGECPYHAVEVMACPGGCIDGAGQPYHHGDAGVVRARWEATYQADKDMPIRMSHENPSVQAIYKEFLGAPLSEKAHHLLHTHYFDKKTKIEPVK